MQKYSYLKSSNADYIDDLFARYSADPSSVDDTWRYFFEGLELGDADTAAHTSGYTNGHAVAPPSTSLSVSSVDLLSEAKVADLISAYRESGKWLADLNPLGSAASAHPDLELSRFGLSTADLTRSFQAGKLIGLGTATLQTIIARLREIYCRTIAVEVLHIQNREVREWILKRIESNGNRDPELTNETRKHILKRLTEAESFERFLHTRYVAAKRFSVEGGDAVIPAIDAMVESCAGAGATDFVFGMAHRGRLNVLAHVMGKPYEQIFTEFEGTYKTDPAQGEGDVKYHKGYSHDDVTRQGQSVHLSLAFNPSHLEFVNAVVEGMSRAKQDRTGDLARANTVPILIHGDAAFAGQGICYETLNFTQLQGYSTGGTLHIVINNQVGFTADPDETRSTPYATDLAKMLDAPIFHVNGDDAEAVWWTARLCAEFRQKFKLDTFIDLICYRKHGHNEGDEPAFTQPLMYKKIKAHLSPREIYAAALARSGASSAAESLALVEGINAKLAASQVIAKKESPQPHISIFEGAWKGLRRPVSEGELFVPAKTAVDEQTLRSIGDKICTMPPGFHLHSKLQRIFELRAKALADGKGIDWGLGEALAFCTLLGEGHPVRLSGQDAERGTFSHRHSVLHDVETGKTHTPFNSFGAKAPYEGVNSHLSETGVLGFEYGYAITAPQTLTIWEAQFGDFGNGAQVIIDQFIATGESKWQRSNGLVLLLPHGYEGQGPEHSSARLERFLSLAGKMNMQVTNLTTPAQLFHALRRQLRRDFRKPLVVMSPKSLLRNPLAVSELKDFSTGGFQEVIADSTAPQASRVILCSGKVYYDLSNERIARKITDDVALIRVEQLYPWPADALVTAIARHPKAREFVWAQEEPRNMGGWPFVHGQWAGTFDDFGARFGGARLHYAGRPVASAPAVGSLKVHEAETKAFIEQAFARLAGEK